MKITVLGATGKTGVEVVKQALEAGHSVVGVVRSLDGLEGKPNLTFIVGDVTDPTVIAEASKDSDVIISTLGTTSMKSTLMADAVKAVITASGQTGCKRFILLSSFIVKPAHLKGVVRLAGGMMRGIIDDKSTSEDLIRTSGLDWTIVYAARLTTQPKGSGSRVLLEAEKIGLGAKIGRADVAAYMLAEAMNNAYVKAEITIAQ